jgi:hypothetical protein
VAVAVAVAALALLGLAGCGGSSDRSLAVDGGSSDPVNPRNTEPSVSEQPPIEVAAPDGSPGVDPQLVDDALPEGWSYSRRHHPKGQNVNPTVIEDCDGAPVDVAVPGGGQAYQSIGVTAVWRPGMQASGAAADLRSLISPQVWEVVGFFDPKDTTVGYLNALLLTRKSVFGEDHMIMFAGGDWWVQVNGAEVDVDTLFAFAQGVDVR